MSMSKLNGIVYDVYLDYFRNCKEILPLRQRTSKHDAPSINFKLCQNPGAG